MKYLASPNLEGFCASDICHTQQLFISFLVEDFAEMNAHFETNQLKENKLHV